jgi:hypothetical protein
VQSPRFGSQALKRKSIITEVKISLVELSSRFELLEERIMNLKTDQYRLCTEKNRKKKEGK